MPGPWTSAHDVVVDLKSNAKRRADTAWRMLQVSLVLSILALLLSGDALSAPRISSAQIAKTAQAKAQAASQAVKPAALSILGMQAIVQWASAQDVQVPLAQGLGTHLGGSTSTPTHILNWQYLGGSDTIASVNGKSLERVTEKYAVELGVATGARWFEVQLQMTLLNGQTPEISAWPFLEPLPGPTPRIPLQTPGVAPSLSATAKAHIGQWISAWAANDQADMYQYSGQNLSIHFNGLGGFQVTSWQPLSERILPDNTAQLMVEVVLKETGTQVSFTDYLRLLLGNTQATWPSILGWGSPFGNLQQGAGTAPGLAN